MKTTMYDNNNNNNNNNDDDATNCSHQVRRKLYLFQTVLDDTLCLAENAK